MLVTWDVELYCHNYLSKSFPKEEKNYCVTRREILASFKAVKDLHQCYGWKVTVRTNHSSLTWLFQINEPKGQLARWLEVLTQYNITLEHPRGMRHGYADGLSRQWCQNCKQCDRMRGDNDPGEITKGGHSAPPIIKFQWGCATSCEGNR